MRLETTLPETSRLLILTMVCDQLDWDSDEEKLGPPNLKNKQPLPAHAHVPTKSPVVETDIPILE